VAWLSSVPTDKTVAQRDTSTRGERMRADGVVRLPSPPVHAEAAYLCEHLFDAGPVSVGGMGAVALTYADLQAWSQMTGTPVEPWEAQTLRAMSRAYVAEARAAEDPTRPPPWAMPEPEDRAALSKRIGEALRARARPRTPQ